MFHLVGRSVLNGGISFPPICRAFHSLAVNSELNGLDPGGKRRLNSPASWVIPKQGIQFYFIYILFLFNNIKN